MKLGDKNILRVFAKHDPYWNTTQPSKVINEMEELGPPTINVVAYRGDYFATEGSHRLFAAWLLELVPNLIISDPERFDQSDEEFWETVKERIPHYSWLL